MKKLRLVRSISAAVWGFIVSPLAALVPLPLLRGGAVFLVHPRVIEDTFLQFPFLRPLPEKMVSWILRHLPPVIGPAITLEGRVIGRTIFCPWTVKMMLEDREGARAALQRAARTARHLGAKWLAPGALAASMTSLGRDLEGNGMTVTTGHTATTIFGGRILLAALEKVGVEPSLAKVAIVGAGGNISSTLASRLGGKVGSIILMDLDVGGKVRRMERRARELRSSGTEAEVVVVRTESDYRALAVADAVFTATSNPEPFLKAQWLREGAILVDDSQPLSISRQEAEQHSGIALQVLARTPGVDAHFWFQRGVGRREIQYTCLAELLSLATNGTQQGVTGPVGEEDAERIAHQLRKAGYELVFQSFGRTVTEEDWESVRRARGRPG